jgi:endonuclease/exonuclease/phosphatase family metal-dependent hydrolase
MTFNVRQADGDDGDHSWTHRKYALVETIRDRLPIILGTQETHPEQVDYILSALPEYAAFGQGRYGDGRDKHNKIFYLRDQVELIDTGETWFSETPHLPGSASWGIPRPRMVTWGRVRIAGRELLVMNTHLPYGRSAEEPRKQATRIILKQLDNQQPGLPVLLMGDFNTPADGEIYHLLTQQTSDAWQSAMERRGPDGTVHGFGKFDGARIDWILHRHCGQVQSVETITDKKAGLFPSDHYPVFAVFNNETS